MIELLSAGGWLMVPIVLCSVLALAIIIDRFWSLRRSRVTPEGLRNQVKMWALQRELNPEHTDRLRNESPLGRIFAAALENRQRPREIVKEAVQDTGRHVVHDLERFLNTLGTIAGVSPLLGLLGTVIGMIQVFSSIVAQGVGNPGELAGGISQALITTAAGLTVAIPAYFFYRYFRGRIAAYVVNMEQQAMELIETLDRRRQRGKATRGGDDAVQ